MHGFQAADPGCVLIQDNEAGQQGIIHALQVLHQLVSVLKTSELQVRLLFFQKILFTKKYVSKTVNVPNKAEGTLVANSVRPKILTGITPKYA